MLDRAARREIFILMSCGGARLEGQDSTSAVRKTSAGTSNKRRCIDCSAVQCRDRWKPDSPIRMLKADFNMRICTEFRGIPTAFTSEIQESADASELLHRTK